MKTPPLIVIAGPTASGKTALALRLAKEFGGEIISADSRAVYRGLDIGTAKPSSEEQNMVRHWGIDIVDPSERFTAEDFQRYVRGAIYDIRSRGKIPMLVGGTGLYIDAVIYDFVFPSEDLARRRELEKMTLEELHNYCLEHNIQLPKNAMNPRHVVHTILRNGASPQRRETIRANTFVVGIATDKEILRMRISKRADEIFASMIIDEARSTGERFGWDSQAMTGNVYPIMRKVIAGELSLNHAKELFRISDWQLAKRQLTWFRRDKNISWLSLDDAYTYLARVLVNANKS